MKLWLSLEIVSLRNVRNHFCMFCIVFHNISANLVDKHIAQPYTCGRDECVFDTAKPVHNSPTNRHGFMLNLHVRHIF